MVKFLKKMKDIAPVKTIRHMLHNELAGPEPARSVHVIHASELTKDGGMCPRQYAIMRKTGAKAPHGRLTTSEQVTFELGRMLQRSMILWLAGMGKAVCDWRCHNCNSMARFTVRPVACTECGCRSFEPEEPRFESGINGASCGIDVLVSGLGPKLRICEVKTMDKDEFKKLVAPLAEHRWRTNLYMRIVDEAEAYRSKLIDTKVATIFYISKGGYGVADPTLKELGTNEYFSPFKEFTVKRDDSATDILVAPAKAVKDFTDGNEGMPFGVCKTAMDKRAKGCPVKKQCFSGDFPPVNNWKED